MPVKSSQSIIVFYFHEFSISGARTKFILISDINYRSVRGRVYFRADRGGNVNGVMPLTFISFESEIRPSIALTQNSFRHRVKKNGRARSGQQAWVYIFSEL